MKANNTMNTLDGAAGSVNQVREHWAAPASQLQSSLETGLWVSEAACFSGSANLLAHNLAGVLFQAYECLPVQEWSC